MHDKPYSKNQSENLCIRCGKCCFVDMVAYLAEADIRRWEREGRYDILFRVREGTVLWSGDSQVSSSGERLKNCMYLCRDGSSFYCEIYATRPLVCRNYIPGSSELCPLYSDKK